MEEETKNLSLSLDGDAMGRALKRISYEIIEKNKGTRNVVLIGIQRRGVLLANRLAELIRMSEGIDLPVGTLDITFYRDDLSMLSEHPVINGTDIDFVIEGKSIVLVDRGHRELPIRADYVGKNVPTSRSERIDVCLTELDGEDRVCVEKR